MSAKLISGRPLPDLARGWAIPTLGGTWHAKAHYMRRIGGNDILLCGPIRADYTSHCGLYLYAYDHSPLVEPGNYAHCKHCEVVERKRAAT